jgi:prepilin-type N-terminal cleavage/methylation domain-containing protein
MRARRGFSLIEVMISAALFFVGLVAVLSTYHVASRLLSHHRHLTHAVVIGEAVLEDLIHRYPGDGGLAGGVHAGPSYDDAGRLTSSTPTFTTSWEVSNYAKVTGIREVTVTVTWTEDGATKTMPLTTWRL